MSDKDIVEEARELLAKATPRWEQSQLAPAYVISLAEGHEVIMSFAEYDESGEIVTEFKNAISNMALAVRAPELLRALTDEVERLRKQAVEDKAAFDELYGFWKKEVGAR